MSIGSLLGGATQLGTQVFNARAQADERIEEKKREEEEREQQRRMQALQMAVTELNLDHAKRKFPLELSNLRRRGARDDFELGRLEDGLPPVPGQPRPTPAEVEADAAARTRGNLQGQIDIYRDPENLAALEAIRNERPDSPPSTGEVGAATRQVVDSLLQQDPTMQPEDIFDAITSPEWLQEQDPAMRLLIEGGRINQTAIRAAFRRYGDAAGIPSEVIDRLNQVCREATENNQPSEEAFNRAMRIVQSHEQGQEIAESSARYFQRTCRPGLM